MKALLAAFTAALLLGANPVPQTLRVGSVRLHRCARVPAYCGSIVRALDPAHAVPGTIRVGFTWLPRSGRGTPATGTILAMEGGPGYPSGGSFDAYLNLFRPLLRSRNMLLVDDRGTGRSGALLCRAMQDAAVSTVADVARCGRHLGDRADLYGTVLVADDVAAVLDALQVGKVTVYGDSYGTFAAQTFAGRHPGHVRAIVLDGAYPVVGSDPWLASVPVEMRRAFDRVCRRSPACAALPGTSLERIESLLAALRRPGAPVTPPQLAFVMASAGLNPIVYRELDAAARAYLAGDRVPLLRVVREAYANEEKNGSDPRTFSAADFAAASCSDDPEPYDMTLPPALRVSEWKRVLAAKQRSDPKLYAPFTMAEYLAMPPDYGYVALCTQWPVASAAHPAREPLLPDPRLPDVPVLVMVGDLDTITTPQESAAAAALFAHHTLVVVKNTGHVTAVGDVYDCASAIVRRFVATLQPGSTSCARRIPAVRLVASFRQHTSAAFTVRDAIRAAASDALARVIAYGAAEGRGLRGGAFRAKTTGDVTTIHLHGVRWTNDVPVDGTLIFDAASGKAVLDARSETQHLRTSWNAYGR
jgi:pimeloyl-ACP methyl ester carboxylesterase